MMKQNDSKIRHLSVATNKFYVATALFEKTVAIWDMHTRQQIKIFNTVLDFGGQRLALSRDGHLCIVGAYHRYGVTAYNTYTGQVTWKRKDLTKVQRIHASPNHDYVYCCFEDKPCHVVDLQDGQTLQKYRGVRKAFESSYGPKVFLYKHQSEIRDLENEVNIELQSLELGVICAAFSPEQLVVSGKYTDCFDLQTGKKLWRYEPPPGSHALEVEYHHADRAFFIVQWSYEKGGSKILVRLNEKDGKPETILDLGEPAETLFCMQGHWLVLSDGRVIEVVSGQEKKRQDFALTLIEQQMTEKAENNQTQ